MYRWNMNLVHSRSLTSYRGFRHHGGNVLGPIEWDWTSHLNVRGVTSCCERHDWGIMDDLLCLHLISYIPLKTKEITKCKNAEKIIPPQGPYKVADCSGAFDCIMQSSLPDGDQKFNSFSEHWKGHLVTCWLQSWGSEISLELLNISWDLVVRISQLGLVAALNLSIISHDLHELMGMIMTKKGKSSVGQEKK